MNSPSLTRRKDRHILQKTAKIIGVVSIIAAFFTGGYLLTLINSEDKGLKASFGAVSFFCFMIGLVLNSIGSANLPDLSVPSDEEVKKQIREFEQSKY